MHGTRGWVRVVYGLGMLGAVAGAVLGLMASANWLGEIGFGLLVLASQTAFLSIGALIVARQPDNRIGLLFLAIGLLLVTAFITGAWAEYGLLKDPGSLPFTTAAAVFFLAVVISAFVVQLSVAGS